MPLIHIYIFYHDKSCLMSNSNPDCNIYFSFCTNTIENSLSFVSNSQIKIDRFGMKKHRIAFVLMKCFSAFNVQIDRAITVIQCFFQECWFQSGMFMLWNLIESVPIPLSLSKPYSIGFILLFRFCNIQFRIPSQY